MQVTECTPSFAEVKFQEIIEATNKLQELKEEYAKGSPYLHDIEFNI